MDELIISLFGMIVTGLAFVVYRHPTKGRKIIVYGAIIYCILYIIYLSNIYGTTNGMNKSMDVIFETGKQSQLFKDIYDNRLDNLSGDSATNQEKLNLKLQIELIQSMHKKITLDSLLTKITIDRDEVIKERDKWRIFFFIGLAILAALYFVSDLFNNNGKPNRKKNDNSSD